MNEDSDCGREWESERKRGEDEGETLFNKNECNNIIKMMCIIGMDESEE